MTTTNRIKELRTKQDKTLRDVAKAVNTSNQNISNWERGKSEPKLEMWKKLADYFGVDVGYLQGVTDVKNSNTKMYTSDPNKMTKEQLESELFSYVKKVGTEQFRKEGDARILQGASDNLAVILKVVNEIEKDNFDDPTFNYNESISNLETRSKLYSSITELTDLATYDDVGSRLLFTLLSGLIIRSSETHLINTYISENDIDAINSGAHEAVNDGINAIEVLLGDLKDFVNEIKAQNKKASDDKPETEG